MTRSVVLHAGGLSIQRDWFEAHLGNEGSAATEVMLSSPAANDYLCGDFPKRPEHSIQHLSVKGLVRSNCKVTISAEPGAAA